MIEYLNTPVFYTSKGSGNPLILLHGFLETSKIWDQFVSKLSAKRQVICIDLPGHGKTGNYGKIHSMELMAEVVSAVLEYLNVDKATIVGHSMGGYAALAFAEKYPDKLAGIVLMNSTPEADSEERKLIRDRAVDLVKRNRKAYIKMAISNLTGPGINDKIQNEIELLKEEPLKMSKENIIASLEGMKIRTNRIEMLRNLTSYKIMILGKEDPILELEIAKNTAILSKCPLIFLDGGHLSYIENSYIIEKIMLFID